MQNENILKEVLKNRVINNFVITTGKGKYSLVIIRKNNPDKKETTQDFKSMLTQLFTHRKDLTEKIISNQGFSHLKPKIFEIAEWLDTRGFDTHVKGNTLPANVRLFFFNWTGL